MAWYAYVAWFFAGAFLTNAIPHIVQGICGNKFQSPFATPPGIGESWSMSSGASSTSRSAARCCISSCRNCRRRGRSVSRL
jgi:hypothetical protein